MIDWMLRGKHKLKLPTADEALPGRLEPLKVDAIHTVLQTELKPPYPEGTEVAYFGMGCFWGAEKLFWNVEGVYTTAVGYGAGITPNPTYEEVCSGLTGHNELVKVVFYPDRVSYQELLKVFWENHNPCEGMRQGNDVGTQYRSGIYTSTEQQSAAAAASKSAYDKALSDQSSHLSTTEIIDQFDFYYAEEYHQQYLAKNPSGYCPNHSCDATGLPRYPG